MIEPNSRHLGDCFELLPHIEEQSISLIFADLPYGETSNKLDRKLPMEDYIEHGKYVLKKLSRTEFFMDHADSQSTLTNREIQKDWDMYHEKGLWYHFNRILKPDGNILLFAQGHFTTYLTQSNKKQYKYDIIWNKKLLSDHLNAKFKPLRQHEAILVFNNSIRKATYNPQFSEGKPLHSKGKNYMNKDIVNNNYGKVRHTDDVRKGSTQKYPTTIWEFPKAHPSAAQYRTEKPVPLLKRGIETYSNPGDIVLDCTCGSGGIGEAALLTGRKYILMDNDPIAIEKTDQRLSAIQTLI